MYFDKCLWTIFVLYNFLEVCHSQTTISRYVVKKVGEEVLLDIDIDTDDIQYLQWAKDSRNMWFGAPPPGGFTDEFDRPTKFEIDGGDLLIKNLAIDDGGLYRTSVTLASTTHEYQLVVYDDVMCETGSQASVDVGDQLRFECSFEYGGHLDSPTELLKWYERNGAGVVTGDVTEAATTHGMRVTNEYTVSATAAHDAQRHDCRLTFTNNGMRIDQDHPLPASEACHQMYRVNNAVTIIEFYQDRNHTRMVEEGDTFNAGDIIYVDTNGYPLPSVEWFCEDDSDPTMIGLEWEVQQRYAKKSSMTSCTVRASNDADDAVQHSEELLIYISIKDKPKPKAKGTSGSTNAGAVAAAVIIPILIIVIVVVIGGWFILKKKRQQKASLANGGTAAAPEKTPYENKNFQGSENDVKYQPHSDAQPPPPQRGINPNSTPYGGLTHQGYPGKGSPGYADLGVKNLSGSVPGLNESLESLPDHTHSGPAVSADPRGGYKPEPPLRFDNKASDTQV